VSSADIPALRVLRSGKDPLGGLLLEFPGAAPFVAPVVVQAEGGATVDVQVWQSRVTGVDQGAAVGRWLSEHVLPHAKRSTDCGSLRLVYLDAAVPGSARAVKQAYVDAASEHDVDGTVSFADALPVLVASEASLAKLNTWIRARSSSSPRAPSESTQSPSPREGDIPMDRFRANIIVGPSISDEGFPVPFEEDEWSLLQAGTARLVGAKLCTRCVVPTTDQRTGVQGGVDAEPYVTLTALRSRKPGSICFGTVAIPARVHDASDFGAVAIGDALFVLQRRQLPPQFEPTPKATFCSYDA
jgi:uncharacterized protein YcbX